VRIVICDDDGDSVRKLRDLIQDVLTECGRTKADILTAADGMELLRMLKERKRSFDLIFLDIYMPELTGIETAEKIRMALGEIPIVFITTSQEFAVKAFGLRALHYLVKPIGKPDILEVFRRLDIKPKRPGIRVLNHGIELEVYADDIYTVESWKHLNVIHTKNGDIEVRMPLDFVAEQLGAGFILLSRGILVNPEFISRLDGSVCELKDGRTILLSRKKAHAIKEAYMKYVFGRAFGVGKSD